MKDIKLYRKNNYLDFYFNGYDFVSTEDYIVIVEQLFWILLFSKYKKSIEFGVELPSYRGETFFNQVLYIIMYRIVNSWAFYRSFIDSLPVISIVELNKKNDKIYFKIKFEKEEIAGEV